MQHDRVKYLRVKTVVPDQKVGKHAQRCGLAVARREPESPRLHMELVAREAFDGDLVHVGDTPSYPRRPLAQIQQIGRACVLAGPGTVGKAARGKVL